MQYEFLKKIVLFIKQIKSITITIKGLRKDSSPKTELNFWKETISTFLWFPFNVWNKTCASEFNEQMAKLPG